MVHVTSQERHSNSSEYMSRRKHSLFNRCDQIYIHIECNERSIIYEVFVYLKLCGRRDTVYNLHMTKEGKTSEESVICLQGSAVMFSSQLTSVNECLSIDSSLLSSTVCLSIRQNNACTHLQFHLGWKRHICVQWTVLH